ncbi:XTP/dITP diphosphohydrolase [Sulfurivirga caldicuralii]|uniref:XTP/dITP diphosphohydrolase n=1 Tax=Sulfurivirga caldicuralii TaxID=364032 RepID=A0A1N6DKC4_9GAMM|nr:non-canonical purine NTP pyrophosphatase [Sulfurivirga caldicuralii]SIN71245.1 XTP/dITP diphosphohydrolase [Sulfurivirga caldicuralii]
MIILATSNPHKIAEIALVLDAFGIDWRPQSDFFSVTPPEEGASFLENALAKARYASRMTGLPAIADDSGLEVFSLQRKPGIFSARYACDRKDPPSDDDNVAKLLDVMRPITDYRDRQARYVTSVVYVHDCADATPIVEIAYLYGEILKERRTGGGVGYDDVMWIPHLAKTVSELSPQQKFELSQRVHAFRAVLSNLVEEPDIVRAHD